MTVHLKIYGRVQGVFFRRNAKIEAEKLGIGGWVRNRQSLRSSPAKPDAGLDADGSVEIMAEGEKEKIDQFVKWCKKGPPFSKVEKVEVDFPKSEEAFGGFEIIED